MADANITAKVTVLTPPAVPTGEPPINISNRQTIAEESVRFSCAIVAKPAVLVVTDWKRDICSLSKKLYSLRVSGLLYSNSIINAAPVKIKIRVAQMAILLWSVRFAQKRLF